MRLICNWNKFMESVSGIICNVLKEVINITPTNRGKLTIQKTHDAAIDSKRNMALMPAELSHYKSTMEQWFDQRIIQVKKFPNVLASLLSHSSSSQRSKQYCDVFHILNFLKKKNIAPFATNWNQSIIFLLFIQKYIHLIT